MHVGVGFGKIIQSGFGFGFCEVFEKIYLHGSRFRPVILLRSDDICEGLQAFHMVMLASDNS